MAKNSKKRKDSAFINPIAKKLKQQHPNGSKPESIASPTKTEPESTSNLIDNLIYDDELEITTETLATLSKNPHLISLKALKAFRTAVHDYWRVSSEISLTGTNTKRTQI